MLLRVRRGVAEECSVTVTVHLLRWRGHGLVPALGGRCCVGLCSPGRLGCLYFLALGLRLEGRRLSGILPLALDTETALPLLVHLGPRGYAIDGDVQQPHWPDQLYQRIQVRADGDHHVCFCGWRAVCLQRGLVRTMRAIVENAVGVDVQVVHLGMWQRRSGTVYQRVTFRQPAVKQRHAHRRAHGRRVRADPTMDVLPPPPLPRVSFVALKR